ncbi:MAG: ABC transporter permease [Alphaproteobacteria bacterium]|nr:ABC transporter permease [Alphaproteobacteria bacterium]
MATSVRRIGAPTLRHLYLFRGSWPRLLELAYWPTMQMVLWGFMTVFLASQTSYVAQAFGVLLSAALLRDVLFRGQLGISVTCFEEMYSRNLGHLFVSPLRPWEMVASLMTMSLFRTVVGVVPASFLSLAFFGFSIYSLGLPLVGFFVNLIVFSWAFGLVIAGLVLRFGLGAEGLAWAGLFALAPVSGIYYPVAVLPHWLQAVAAVFPSTHVFEGMRAIVLDGVFRGDLMATAVLLNAAYLAAGTDVFLRFFHTARIKGLLLQMRE